MTTPIKHAHDALDAAMNTSNYMGRFSLSAVAIAASVVALADRYATPVEPRDETGAVSSPSRTRRS